MITGKRAKNNGGRNTYFIIDSHEAIVSKELFIKAQEERCKRTEQVSEIEKETVKSRYNGKNILNNILVCGYCGASFRRRTERGKIIWRCATRIEKGKCACVDSPSLNEEEIKEYLKREVCGNQQYDEDTVRDKSCKVIVCSDNLEIKTSCLW